MKIKLWRETGTKRRSSKNSQRWRKIVKESFLAPDNRRTRKELYLGWILRSRQKKNFFFFREKGKVVFTWVKQRTQIAIGIFSKGKLLPIKPKQWGGFATEMKVIKGKRERALAVRGAIEVQWAERTTSLLAKQWGYSGLNAVKKLALTLSYSKTMRQVNQAIFQRPQKRGRDIASTYDPSP